MLGKVHDIFSCLHLKSLCKRIPECRVHLRHLESKCGISLQRCHTSQISDCVHCLRSIKETLGVYNATCWCYENLGALRKCSHFRTKIWSHPCEKRLSDFGIQNRLFQLAAEDPQPIEDTLLLTEESPDDVDVFEKSTVIKRTTRSPMATEIEQWRHQLSGVLPSLRSFKSELSCNAALYDVCLKHISCRELWKIFRESCIVDAQNQCRMTNKDNCWQSFEGISWTGLGNCTCVDRNSDCHWIRLQTNYNKCIYELSLSGYTSRYQTSPSTYIQQYQHHISNYQGNAQSYETRIETTTTLLPTTTTTTPKTYPLTVTDNYEHIRRAQEWDRRNQERIRLQKEREEKLKQERQKLEEEKQKLARQRLEEERQRLERQRIEEERQRLERQRMEERRKIYEEEARKAEEYRRKIMAMQNSTVQSSRTRNQVSSVENENSRNRQDIKSQVFTGTIRADLRTTNRIQSTSETVTTTLDKPPTDYYRYSSSHRPNTTRTRITQTKLSTTSTTNPPTTTTTEKPPIVTLSAPEDVSTSTEITLGSSISRTFTGAPISSPPHLQLSSRAKHGESTCQKAHKRCELNETCKWHLSEVQMRCNSDSSCIRQQCASALRRFSRYVNKELAEAITFCQCLPGDSQCKEYQHLIYPRCMYAHPEKSPKENCLEAVKICKKESYCNRHLSSFNKSCSITTGGICGSKNLPECRQALMSIRGTPLEMPCYCPEDDNACLFEQSLMLPSNPCVELAMEDYAKSHPDDYSKPSRKFETDLSVDEPSGELKNDIQSLSSPSITTTTKEPSSEVTLAPSLSNSTENYDNDEQVEDILMEKKKVKVSKTTPKEIIQMTSKSNQQITEKEIAMNTTDAVLLTTTKPYRRKNLHTYPTDAYVTQTPPLQGGCTARNIDGSWITHYKNSIQYTDWSGRCSSWCECSEDEKLTCHELPCLEDAGCQTDQTQLAFGEKLYVDERGACICHAGEFVCDTASDFPDELDAGLYISLGFSSQELRMFREKVPKKFRERSGLVSPESSVIKDIVSRLQFALERDTLCRIIIVEDLTHDDNVVLQLQWFGVDPYTNITEPHWHIGKMEKICAPYIKQLQYTFLLEKADRYQLLLSAVKQLTVFDLLDGLPPLNSASVHSFSMLLLISLLGIFRGNIFLFY